MNFHYKQFIFNKCLAESRCKSCTFQVILGVRSTVGLFILKLQQIMRTPDTKKPSKRPEVRNLKIHPHIRLSSLASSTVPEIKLCGNWLEKLGFIPEQRVNITTMNKFLIIRVEE